MGNEPNVDEVTEMGTARIKIDPSRTAKAWIAEQETAQSDEDESIGQCPKSTARMKFDKTE